MWRRLLPPKALHLATARKPCSPENWNQSAYNSGFPAGSGKAMPNSWSYPQTAVCHPLCWADVFHTGWKTTAGPKTLKESEKIFTEGIISPCWWSNTNIPHVQLCEPTPCLIAKTVYKGQFRSAWPAQQPQTIAALILWARPLEIQIKASTMWRRVRTHSCGWKEISATVTTIWEVLSAMQPTPQVLTRALTHTRSMH